MTLTDSFQPQDRAFFALLQQQTDLDLRDTRGKRHPMPLVLMGVLMAMLAGRDGSLSSIHRYLVNQFEWLAAHFQPAAKKPISRAQLPRLLALVNPQRFLTLVVQTYGFPLSQHQQSWLAGDGKELRGSIAPGQTRGISCVSIVDQQSQLPLAQCYYDGRKQGERTSILNLLTDNGLLCCKVSLDALHLTPALLTAIAQQQGCYLIGLKSNQHQLLRSCILQTLVKPAHFVQIDQPEHKHGRHQEREYRYYSLADLALDKRWSKAALGTLIQVKRSRYDGAGRLLGYTESYYVSNAAVACQSEATTLYEAVRGHWRVEVMHYRRDVVFWEDSFRSLQSGVQQIIGTFRTLALSLFDCLSTSMAHQMDRFSDRITELFDFLRVKRLL